MKSRRQVLKVIGQGGALIALGGTLSGCDPIPDEANEPWRIAGTWTEDPRLNILSYAILAPNPHNRQPWIADLREPDRITILPDPERFLPETDPPNRQVLIGLGCFLELTNLAAQAYGFATTITPFPQGEPGPDSLGTKPVATIELTPSDPVVDPHFDLITARRSTKVAYDLERPVSEETLKGLIDLSLPSGIDIRYTHEEKLIQKLRTLTYDAHYVEVTTPRTNMESIELMRIGGVEIKEHRDGIDLGGTMMEVGKATGVITRETLADPNSRAFKIGLDMFKEIFDSGMAYAWIVSEENDRLSQLNAGRVYVHLNLQAIAIGLGLHPHSQLLQEFAEMSDLQGKLYDTILPERDGTIQMFARLGYGPAQEATPRRRLKDIIL